MKGKNLILGGLLLTFISIVIFVGAFIIPFMTIKDFGPSLFSSVVSIIFFFLSPLLFMVGVSLTIGGIILSLIDKDKKNTNSRIELDKNEYYSHNEVKDNNQSYKQENSIRSSQSFDESATYCKNCGYKMLSTDYYCVKCGMRK